MKDGKIKCPGCKGRVERHIEYEKDCCFWTVALVRDLEKAFCSSLVNNLSMEDMQRVTTSYLENRKNLRCTQ